jgi:hypothetical protein
MGTPLVVTGDDFSVQVQLKRGIEGATAPFTISGTGSVKARLVSVDHKQTYTAEVSQIRDLPGADWSNSLVVINFSASDTAAIIYQGKAKIEIQVTDPLKSTWWVDCTIRKGNIA